MTTARAARIRTRVAVIAASLVTLNSIVVLIGWAAGWSIFLTPSPDFIPMAPTTALAFLALSAALGARMLAPRGSAVRNAGTALGWLVASMAIVNIVVPTLLDQALGGSTGQFGRVPLGVMSPVTAAALVPLALAIAAIRPRPHYAAAGTIPVALPTGLSLLLLGTATVLAVGPNVWPLEPLVGDGPRARMLRSFLPATAALVVLIGFLDARFAGYFGLDRVLIASWLAVLGAALTTLLVSRLSRTIGDDIDRAYAERHRAELRFRTMFEQGIAGVSTTRM